LPDYYLQGAMKGAVYKDSPWTKGSHHRFHQDRSPDWIVMCLCKQDKMPTFHFLKKLKRLTRAPWCCLCVFVCPPDFVISCHIKGKQVNNSSLNFMLNTGIVVWYDKWCMVTCISIPTLQWRLVFS
jgi:hypothetical protein